MGSADSLSTSCRTYADSYSMRSSGVTTANAAASAVSTTTSVWKEILFDNTTTLYLKPLGAPRERGQGCVPRTISIRAPAPLSCARCMPHSSQAATPQLLNSFPILTALTPPTAAAFSIMMLATAPAGDAYTFAELESISTSADFARVDLAPPEIGLDRLVIAYR